MIAFLMLFGYFSAAGFFVLSLVLWHKLVRADESIERLKHAIKLSDDAGAHWHSKYSKLIGEKTEQPGSVLEAEIIGD